MKHKTIDTPKIVNIFILNDYIVRVTLSFDYIVETLRIKMFTIFGVCIVLCFIRQWAFQNRYLIKKSVWIEAYQNMGQECYS